MTALGLYLRASLRSRWRSWARLVLLIGVLGGVVVAIATTAHRTATVVDRYLEDRRPSHVSVSWGPTFGLGNLDPEKVKALPEVDEAHFLAILFFRGRTSRGRVVTNDDFGIGGSPDVREFRAVDRERMKAGRLPAPGAADEIAPDEMAARGSGLQIGDTLDVRLPTPKQMEGPGPGENPLHFRFAGPHVRLRVVGIRRTIPSVSGDPYPIVELSPAFLQQHAIDAGALPNLNVRLRHGDADAPAFKAKVERLADGDVEFSSSAQDADRLRRSVRIEAIGLWALALVAAIVALLVVLQALIRQGREQAADHATLVAMGTTRRGLIAGSAAWAVVAALAATPLVVGVAVALSPLGPAGRLARALEPDPGVWLDWLVIGVGIAALIALVVLGTLPAAWLQARRAAGRDDPATTPGPAGPVQAMMGRLSPAAGTGLRMALHAGHGRTAVPARSTLLTVVLAIAGVVVALGFAASLDRLTITPRLYGRTWDAQIGDGFGPDVGGQAKKLLGHDRTVDRWALVAFGEVAVGGRRVGAMGIQSVRGMLGPTVVDGRLPSSPDEALLAGHTLSDAGRDIGDTVPVRVGERSFEARIVGRGVIPDETEALRLGHGIVLTMAGLRRLEPRAARNVMFVRFAAGVDRERARVALGKRAGDPSAAVVPGRPVDLDSVSRVDAAPALTAALMALIGLAALAHALGAAARRRRRELAVLRSLGFTRGDVRRAVAWQATTIALVAVLVGVPVGVAAGRWIWNAVADELGVVPEPAVPLLAVLLVVPATLLAANAISAVAGIGAVRRRPTDELRAE